MTWCLSSSSFFPSPILLFPPPSSPRLPYNIGKNRYKDVVCYDDTRVVLKALPGVEVGERGLGGRGVLNRGKGTGREGTQQGKGTGWEGGTQQGRGGLGGRGAQQGICRGKGTRWEGTGRVRTQQGKGDWVGGDSTGKGTGREGTGWEGTQQGICRGRRGPGGRGPGGRGLNRAHVRRLFVCLLTGFRLHPCELCQWIQQTRCVHPHTRFAEYRVHKQTTTHLVFCAERSTLKLIAMSVHVVMFTPSLVPRPHPLTRRNGLVNQVEFLGLVHAYFVTM